LRSLINILKWSSLVMMLAIFIEIIVRFSSLFMLLAVIIVENGEAFFIFVQSSSSSCHMSSLKYVTLQECLRISNIQEYSKIHPYTS
jgi:hypothetical protein